jgi:hypothetical protein
MIGLKLRMNRMIINLLFIWVWKVAILIKRHVRQFRSIKRLTAIICCENLNPWKINKSFEFRKIKIRCFRFQ